MTKQARSKNRALCVWIPQWPVQRVRLARPELKRRDFLLYEQYRRGCFRVVASTHKRGIVPGMPLAEATALAGVHCEEHDPRADRAALVQLAGWYEQFSPLVGIEPPDNLCLNVTGLGPLFGSEALLVEQIARAFRRRELAVRVAVADTLGAAWAVAHYDPESPAVVPTGEVTEAIGSLPIAALRLPPAIVDILSELGIVEIGHLLLLPRDAVAARFDPQLLRRLDQATGCFLKQSCRSERRRRSWPRSSWNTLPRTNMR